MGIGMDGPGWQRLCLQVLHEEHKNDLVPVPDTLRGDAGLEAYTFPGLAYQCYSPDEPLVAQQRYEKQRIKMTTDVGKFIDNADKIAPMLGPVKVSRWILLVPLADSRQIVEHAMRQTERIRAAALSYADDTIFVMIQTLSDNLRASLDSVINRRLAKLFLPPLAEVDFSGVDSEQIEKMRSKLAKVRHFRNQAERLGYVDYLLKANLGGSEHRNYIRDHYPELDDELDDLLQDLEVRLETQYRFVTDDPGALLTKVTTETESRVRRALPNARESDGRVIADGQVAEWLMGCPLDFAGEPVDG